MKIKLLDALAIIRVPRDIALDRDRAELMEQLRAALAGNVAAVPVEAGDEISHHDEFIGRDGDAPPVAPVDPGPPDDLIEVGAAAALARRSKTTMAAWCRENPIDGEAGFAQKIGARWFVSKSRLLRHLASDLSNRA